MNRDRFFRPGDSCLTHSLTLDVRRIGCRDTCLTGKSKSSFKLDGNLRRLNHVMQTLGSPAAEKLRFLTIN